MNIYRISVITPVYNIEKYLSKNLNSVLAQGFSEYELLLIDDGSIDNSVKICDEYAMNHSNIKVFHKTNGGVSSARNLGLDNAHGEYIVFLDGDDWFADNMFQKIEQVILSQNPDMIQFGYCRIDENHEILNNSIPVEKDTYCNSIDEYQQRNCYQGGMCNFLIKRKIIEEYNIRFSENIKYAEDGEFIFKCICFAKNIYVCSDIFYYYLIRNGSASQTKFTVNNINDHLIVLDHLFCFIEQHQLKITVFHKKELKGQLFHYLICFSLMKCSWKDFRYVTIEYKKFVNKYKYQYPQVINGYFPFRIAYCSMFLFSFITRIYLKIRKRIIHN